MESQPVVDRRLTRAQIASWRERGFALVHDLLPEELLRAAHDAAADHYPAAGTEAATRFTNFGSAQKFVFPSPESACNEITLHPDLLQAIADLLDVTPGGLRLTQSDLWPKYGREPGSNAYDNADQRIHCDFPNHTLTHPPPWEQPEAVELIIYLSDFAEAEGGTAVVPREGPDDPAYRWPITHTPGVGDLRYVNDKAHAEAYLAEQAPETASFRAENLYPRERVAHYRFGSVLLYRHDTWHRGTPLKQGTRRLVYNMTFKKADSEWINVLHPGWAWSMYHPTQYMEKVVARASVEQRAVLGFPLPGSPYWSAATIAAVNARYGALGFDPQPYIDALPT
ncbi:MAG: hypothetical protein AAF513_20440 [Pseudomonadota bacterium]